MLLIKNRLKFPKQVQQYECLKGICIGGCISKDDSIEGCSAHAHCSNEDLHKGWICLHHKDQLQKTNTLYHEVAHLLINTSPSIPGHGKAWYDKFIEIGGDVSSSKYREWLGRHFPWLKKYMR